MSEIFAWVPWFKELAAKIRDIGAKGLADRARGIRWNKQGEAALLQHGDDNIDPFSFFRFLSSKNAPGQWERVHPQVSDHFGLTTQVGHDFDNGFYFPTGNRRPLFHDAGTGDPALFWRLFRAAIREPHEINGTDFDAARRMQGVAIPKLTQTLFLINPTAFLPFDEESVIPLQKELKLPSRVSNWETYERKMGEIREMFPRCEPYEIQHFAFAVFGRKELNGKSAKFWQSSTLVDGDKQGDDYWADFRKNGWIYHRGPGEGNRRRLHEPAVGDVVLVRTRTSAGRGIGVVHRNDHREQWAPKQRLHVLWLNTVNADLDGVHRPQAFSAAGHVLDAFRDAPPYAPTFKLLKELGWPDKPLEDDDRPGPGLKGLADETLISEAELRRIAELLEDKKQVIFQGPPGTGKTYLARKLAGCLAESPSRVRLIQFHPSFAYEDFVQGFRPTLKDGNAGFALRDGPLLEMAELARKSDEKHFLIIDEINRGNLSKILGELYFLLEYRNEEARLQYSDKPFSLPDNLYIIGTMNTADRSIALVDLALRRRFHFVAFHPDKPPIQGLLGRWLREHGLEKFGWLEGVLKTANGMLDDQHAAIGPSYFMPKDQKLDEDRIRRIWEHNVLPYIEERLFGQSDRLKEFDLDTLRSEVEGTSVDEGATESSEPADANA